MIWARFTGSGKVLVGDIVICAINALDDLASGAPAQEWAQSARGRRSYQSNSAMLTSGQQDSLLVESHC